MKVQLGRAHDHRLARIAVHIGSLRLHLKVSRTNLRPHGRALPRSDAALIFFFVLIVSLEEVSRLPPKSRLFRKFAASVPPLVANFPISRRQHVLGRAVERRPEIRGCNKMIPEILRSLILRRNHSNPSTRRKIKTVLEE